MSLEQQLRETLRRVRAGERFAALSQEACERARVQVAEDSERALAWVGRVSGVIQDELGNPVDLGLPALIVGRLAFRWWVRRRERRDLHDVWLVRVLTQCHCCLAGGLRVLAQIVCADCSRHACRQHVDPCAFREQPAAFVNGRPLS